MRYAGIIKNDVSAAPGVCVTFFTQGCPHHCSKCHNPETWDFKGGKEFTQDTITEILDSITKNNIRRPFCVMGGEPLCNENLFLTALVVTEVRKQYPTLPIYIWTGYTMEELNEMTSPHLRTILSSVDYIIDGPYIHEQRDITLKMRGSRNQRIYNVKTKTFDF